jgi:hypothetical protein
MAWDIEWNYKMFKIKRRKLFSLIGACILTKTEDGGNCIKRNPV